MEDRLNQIAERLRQVERELADPAVYSDQQRLKNLSREQKELTPVVETFTALQQTEQAIAEAREMLSDPELRELAQEELTRTKEQRERLAEELKRLLLPRDPNDEKKCGSGDSGRCRRRGGRSVCGGPAADVHHVRRAPGLAAGDRQSERHGAGRREGRSVPRWRATERGPG